MTLESGKRTDYKENVPNIVNSGYFRIVELKVFIFFFSCCVVNDLWNFKVLIYEFCTKGSL